MAVIKTKALRTWNRIHTWTSLVCTAFLLMLCLTGLPLIFHHELDHALGNTVEVPERPAAVNSARADLDSIAGAAKQSRPGEVVQFMLWDPDEPRAVTVVTAPAPDSPPELTHSVVVDARTAEVLGEPIVQQGLMYFLLELHVELFVGLRGKLFLGVMGLLFVAAIVSGVVIYGPPMRRLEFGTVRAKRRRRLKWFDLHNLLGIVTVAWALVVGLTGIINTCADLVIYAWQADQVAEMAAPYAGKPPVTNLSPVGEAVTRANQITPDMTPSFVAYPGTLFTSGHHYGVFMRGNKPLTARLLKPVFIDAETGQVSDTRDLPWYVTALLVSQPLHFGDYGGLPLKIIWALFDVCTIVVLVSGLYLWVSRRTAWSKKRRRKRSVGAAPVSEEVMAIK